jgi:hypothetical protein
MHIQFQVPIAEFFLLEEQERVEEAKTFSHSTLIRGGELEEEMHQN